MDLRSYYPNCDGPPCFGYHSMELVPTNDWRSRLDICRLALERESNYTKLCTTVPNYYPWVNLLMAKLIAFGDSFTWGSDMGDTMRIDEFNEKHSDTDAKYCGMYSRRTWQKHVADYLDIDYKCLAQEGCSNQTIYRRFLEALPLINLDDVVSVSFTWRDRHDFYDGEKWETIRPSGTEDNPLTKPYYKFFHNSNQDQIESLTMLNLIISILEAKKVKYIITPIDELIYNDPWHSSLESIKALQDLYADRITWFDGKGFHQWAKDAGYPISPMWHPLEAAHLGAFSYLRTEGKLEKLK